MTDPGTLVHRILPALASLFLAGSAGAEDRGASTLMVYSDSDGTTVVAPRIGAGVVVGELSIDGEVTVDVVSSASVDLVTTASTRGYREVRTGVDLGAVYSLGPGASVSAGYALSIEPDFHNHAVRAGVSRDVFDRMVTLSAGYVLGLSSVGRTGDERYSRSRVSHDLELTWSNVLSQTTVLDVVAGVGIVDGFQANPYRFVRIFETGAPAHATAVVESVPELRLRGTLTGRLRARLLEHLHGLADYRLYLDTWGVSAHMVSLRGAVDFLDGTLVLTAQARGYLQSSADFYRPRYETFPMVPELRTSDKELGRMRTGLAGIDLEWSPSLDIEGTLRLGVGVDFYHMRYVEHPSLQSRTAVVSTVGITWER